MDTIENDLIFSAIKAMINDHGFSDIKLLLDADSYYGALAIHHSVHFPWSGARRSIFYSNYRNLFIFYTLHGGAPWPV